MVKFGRAFTISVAVITIIWAAGLMVLVPTAQAVEGVMAGDLIKIADGSSVCTPSSPGSDPCKAVYYYGTDGNRYAFPNQKTYDTWYSDFSSVKEVSYEDMTSLPLAMENVTYKPGAKMVKITTDPKVYAVAADGTLRWIESEAVAEALYGSDWATKVQDVPDVFFGNYTVGASISSSMDYNVANEKAAATDISTDKGLGGTAGVGALTASLASDTPVAGSVPYSSADVAFTKISLAAGSEDTTVNQITVTRTGLGTDANFASVKLFDGSVQVGTSQNLNSNHQAVFRNLNISIPANTTKKLTVAGNIAATGTAVNGHIIGLSVGAATDIESSATVYGTFPIQGNYMTVANVTIGGAQISAGSVSVPTNVDPDAVDQKINSYKITSTTEDITINQVTAHRSSTASASDSDVDEVSLYNETTGEELGRGVLANGKVTFSNLGIVVARGENVTLSIAVSMVGGSGRTIGMDLSDGTQFTMQVVGNSYGFGITPTGTGAGCYAAAGYGTSCGAATINQGALVVSKGSDTPATGNIALGGSGITLASFDMSARGENVNVTQMQFNFHTTVAGTTAVATDYTNIVLTDADGVIVAGPQDFATNPVTFTDSFIIPMGDTTYYLKSNVSSAATAGTTVVGKLVASSITARGEESGKTTYTTSSGTTVPPATGISGNQQTVLGPALVVTTAATPVATTIVSGAQDVTFAYIDLNAGTGGEDVKVSGIIVTNTITDGGGALAGAVGDIANLELWGDPDTSDGVDENIRLETTNSTATNAATVTFTFKDPLRVSNAISSRLTLKADVVGDTDTDATGACASTNNSCHAFNVASVPTGAVTGWTTNAAVTPTYGGTGQNMSIDANGTLAIDQSATIPSGAQLVSASTGNEIMSYKMSATSEDIDVTQIVLAETGTGSAANVAKIYAYVDGVMVGSPSGYTLDNNSQALLAVEAGTILIPAGEYKTLTLKIDMSPKTQVTSKAQVKIAIAIDTLLNGGGGSSYTAANSTYIVYAVGAASGTCFGDEDTTASNGTTTATPKTLMGELGCDSGNIVNSTGAAAGIAYESNAFTANKGVLKVSVNSSSPSGTQTPGANKEVLRVNLEAVGDDIAIDEMEFCVSGSATGIGAAANTGSVTLLSSDENTTYATLTNAAHDTYWDGVGGANTYYPLDPGAPVAGTQCFSFGRTGASGVTVGVAATNTVVAFSTNIDITAGTTKVLKLKGDTTGAATNTTLQVNIQANSTGANAATTSGIAWRDSGVALATAGVDSTTTEGLPLTGNSLTY